MAAGLFSTAMNSLSILSSRVDKVIGSTPTTPTSEAFQELRHQKLAGPETLIRSDSSTGPLKPHALSSVSGLDRPEVDEVASDGGPTGDELEKLPSKPSAVKDIYQRAEDSWLNAYTWLISTVMFCAGWIASCFHDDKGDFYIYLPAYTLFLTLSNAIFPRARHVPVPPSPPPNRRRHSSTAKKTLTGKSVEDGESAVSSSSSLTSQTHHARARSVNSSDTTGKDITTQRSIRIRLFNENSEKSSKSTKAASVKSPTSPSNSSTLRLTKYPRNTGPPRPLLAKSPPQKTLILDLDETLIHSLSKGGRLTSGHMVEVKLEGQHPILYYVHKRPYCEEFLRKVYSRATLGSGASG